MTPRGRGKPLPGAKRAILPAIEATNQQVAPTLDDARAAAQQSLARGDGGAAIAAALSHSVTALVERVVAPSFEAAPTSWGPMAFAAVGGLGRRELGPYADLDLVLLAPGAPEGSAEFDTFVRELVHPLWDGGMRAHVMVHDPSTWIAEAESEITLCTGLLDLRRILGDASIVDDLRAQARDRFFGDNRAAFVERLAEEAQERHDRYGGTVYLVEPDLKHGPGGLRDLAALQWSLRATYGTADFTALANDDRIPPGMAATLDEARDVLLRLRAALHLAAKRAQERLVFQYQELIPPLIRTLPESVPDEQLVAAIEETMQEYYRAARALLRYGARLRDRCRPAPPGDRPAPRRIDERFAIAGGALVHDPAVPLVDTPVLALDVLRIGRDRQIPLSGPTFDAVAEAVANPGELGLDADPEAQRRFLELLTHPDDVGSPSALELAGELGLTEAVVPEFGPIRGRMQHDAYHVYTVDQHTLAAIVLLKRIARGEHNKDFPLATALHLEVDDPRVLYLAALVHDAGKALAGDQCETGSAIARTVATRAGFSPEAVDRCALLVAEHLTMPLLSQKRDLSDPLLIAEFAGRIRSHETLRELYLLSLVDTASVRPGNLTAWKLTLLDELYLQTRAQLRRGTIVAPREVAREDEPEGMPDRYYGLFHLEMRQQHGGLVERLIAEDRSALLELEFGSGALRLTLVARDRPGLLAQAAAILDDHGIEVLAADVFTSPGPPALAVDVFRVAAIEGPEQGIDVETVSELEQQLQAALPRASLMTPPKPRTTPPWSGVPRTETRIEFDSDPAGERTIVEIETEGGSDVLRRITRAFAAEGLEILIARISSEANRASNVFYVASLDAEARQALARRLGEYLG